MTIGKKNDSGKVDLTLIPFSAQREEALGFMFGESLYGRDNYKEGLQASRLLAAALRHINAFWEGEERASDSGVHHLGHARCCLAMVIELQRLGALIDNRYTTPPPKDTTV